MKARSKGAVLFQLSLSRCVLKSAISFFLHRLMKRQTSSQICFGNHRDMEIQSWSSESSKKKKTKLKRKEVYVKLQKMSSCNTLPLWPTVACHGPTEEGISSVPNKHILKHGFRNLHRDGFRSSLNFSFPELLQEASTSHLLLSDDF